MRRPIVLRITLALVAAVLAAVGYWMFIPVKTVHSSIVTRLLVPQSELPGIAAKATFSAPLPLETSSIPALKAAAGASPGSTGSAASDWFAATANGSSVTLQVDLLPSVSIANEALQQSYAQDVESAALKAASHTLRSSFSLAAGRGALYTTPQPKKSNGQSGGPPVPGAALDVRVDHVVIRETLSGKVSTKANLLSLAARETALIERVEPTLPNLQTTSYPLDASVLYIVVALVAIAAIAVIPDWMRAAGARRRAHEEARARRQYSTRGSKALKRHRVRI